MSFAPSDLILLQLFKQGMADIRANPYLLDFIFDQLLVPENDLLKSYGQREVDRAKRWFMNTAIDVRLAYTMQEIKFPVLAIEMLNQAEMKQYAVLGDVAAPVWDSDVSQNEYVIKPRALAGPYPSVNYSLTTGLVTLPTGFDTELIFPNQALLSNKSQEEYLITSINSSVSNAFYIATDIRDDFTNSYIAPAYKTLKVKRNIIQLSESFNFKMLVNGDPGPLVWMHQIVSYLILKYRKTLLEAKNMFLSTITSGPFMQENPESYGGEVVYSRSIMMDSQSEVTWVSSIDEKLEGVVLDLTPSTTME